MIGAFLIITFDAMKRISALVLFLLSACSTPYQQLTKDCGKGGEILFLKNNTQINNSQKKKLDSIIEYINNNTFDSFYVDFYFAGYKDNNYQNNIETNCQRKASIENYINGNIIKWKQVTMLFSVVTDNLPISKECENVSYIGFGIKRNKNQDYLLSTMSLRNDIFISMYKSAIKELNCPSN